MESTRHTDRFVTTGAWIPMVVIGLTMLPLVLTSRSFGTDWTIHLWMVRQQQWNIEAMWHPGLFISARPLGVFYPIFAYVGSGAYSLGGYLAILLGNRPILAYKLLYLLGLCLAFGGMTWLSLQAGLRGWRSQIAGVTLVTGAYTVTNMFGRGDFGEFIALSSIPFVIAAGWALLTSDAHQQRNMLAMVLGAFVLTGSHNITLLFGTIFIVVLAAVALVAFGFARRREVSWKRACAVVCSAAIGVGLNAWFLLPDVAYSSHTLIAQQNRYLLPKSGVVVRAAALLNPLRPMYARSPYGRGIRLALPWMLFGWAIIVAMLAWRGGSVALKRLFIGVVALAVGSLLLSVSPELWKPLPKLLYNVQYTWRLSGYVLLSTALLVILALRFQLRLGKPVRRATMAVLVAILVFDLGVASWQAWRFQSAIVTVDKTGVATSAPTRATYLDSVVAAHYSKPQSWYGGAVFVDVSREVVAVPPGRMLTIPAAAVRGAKFVGRLRVPDGRAPFATNISGGSEFVRMIGIRPVGRTATGFIVAVRADDEPQSGPIVVSIAPAHSRLLDTGVLLSLLSVVGLLVLLCWPTGRWLWARRRVVSPSPRQTNDDRTSSVEGRVHA
jgi:hypothetical protein